MIESEFEFSQAPEFTFLSTVLRMINLELWGKSLPSWDFFSQTTHAYSPVPNVCLFVYFERASQMFWTLAAY